MDNDPIFSKHDITAKWKEVLAVQVSSDNAFMNIVLHASWMLVAGLVGVGWDKADDKDTKGIKID